MDEVDVILHPLKSELNYPFGDKEPLQLSPIRWEVSMHTFVHVYIHTYMNELPISSETRSPAAASNSIGHVCVCVYIYIHVHIHKYMSEQA
jgi:hypothetical protein